ncbi:hypothetical protein N8T08_007701 [Aspergillus melleus]|uniref:Uncharacterized protein n=1 Tax=Aspergillus melleus TaxID=138277 RepID=A0ACC3BDZ8_9EURO|nr:hypothetical protein N8T08_007701 [Aspergillus melleus]
MPSAHGAHAHAKRKSRAEKPISHHVENDVEQTLKGEEATREAMRRGQGKSGLEHLTPFETIKTFKFATAVGVLSSFCAATEGYQAIAPVRIRGAITMLYQFWWALGSFMGQIAIRDTNERTPYRYLTAIYTQWGHVGFMFIIFLVLPESLSWYASKGREADAKKTLKWLKIPAWNFGKTETATQQLLRSEDVDEK